MAERTAKSRRSVLKGLVSVAVGGAATTLVPDEALANLNDLRRLVQPRRPPWVPEMQRVLVYRLRTRKTKACRACRLHHRYTVFRSRLIADRNRAHVGCDCPIVAQGISKLQYRRLFPPGSNGVAELPRPHLPPPCGGDVVCGPGDDLRGGLKKGRVPDGA